MCELNQPIKFKYWYCCVFSPFMAADTKPLHLEMSLFVAVSFSYSMEVRFFLPDGVFLPCGHGMDFDMSLCAN